MTTTTPRTARTAPNGRATEQRGLPPHSIESETIVLGALIAAGVEAPDRAGEVFDRMGAEAFYIARNATIYAMLSKLYREHAKYDATMLLQAMRDAGPDIEKDCGGIDYITELLDSTPSTATLDYHAGRVLELARLRRVEVEADAVLRLANAGDADGLADRIRALTEVADRPDAPRPMAFGDLREANSRLHTPVIDGLLRRGETANIISAPKIGKSWLAYDLALAVITGGRWLGRFRCEAGPVLFIDNELHPATIAHRIPKVAEARGIDVADYGDGLDVLALRGRGVCLPDLGRYIDRTRGGHYAAVICDAWYRLIPPGTNENDNAAIMSLYNTLDGYAQRTGAAWLVIHHSTKGVQGEKSVTDVGAGAGSQSRAADAHVILRQHEEPGAVVLEAAVRSFAPVEPLGLRWEFPVWETDYTLDVGAVRGRKSVGEERQDERDREGADTLRGTLTAGEGMTVRQLMERTGYGRGRVERLLSKLVANGEAVAEETTMRGGRGCRYRLADIL